MALTAYCKKCGREVEPGEVCPRCGTKLGKTAAHAAWCLDRRPAADWMCWNAVMRIVLPVGLAVLVLILLLELISGGAGALERMMVSGLPVTLGILLGAVIVLVGLVLLLQGKDLADYVVDSRGIHITHYLPAPTALKLIMRLKSPSLMNTLDPEAPNPVLQLDSRDLAWKDISRVQLWPEKCYVLFYAPAGWLRAAVRCTPFTWEDTLDFVREKLGKKKKVSLPGILRVQAEKKPAARRSSGRSARPERMPDSERGPLMPPEMPEEYPEEEPAGAYPAEAYPEQDYPAPEYREPEYSAQESPEAAYPARDYPEQDGPAQDHPAQEHPAKAPARTRRKAPPEANQGAQEVSEGQMSMEDLL